MNKSTTITTNIINHESNISEVASAGADTFVAGSAIFNKSSYVDAIKDLKDNFN